MTSAAIKVGAVPLISIGMPVYNCARTLGMAIESIVRQSFSEWELIVADDGSIDQTVQVARSFRNSRIRCIADGVHRGLAERLNQAVSLSRGRYFARMDGDDISYPERLALQLGRLESQPDIDVLAGGLLVFGRNGAALGTRENRITHEDICRRPWAGFYFAHPTWMGRTEWFRNNPYRSDALRCEDQDLLLRTYQRSRFAALLDIVLGYREEQLSLGNILRGRRSFLGSVVREAVARRNYSVALSATVEQCAKGLLDIVAISTGLDHSLLRHRASPVSRPEEERWAAIWGLLMEKQKEFSLS